MNQAVKNGKLHDSVLQGNRHDRRKRNENYVQNFGKGLHVEEMIIAFVYLFRYLYFHFHFFLCFVSFLFPSFLFHFPIYRFSVGTHERLRTLKKCFLPESVGCPQVKWKSAVFSLSPNFIVITAGKVAVL